MYAEHPERYYNHRHHQCHSHHHPHQHVNCQCISCSLYPNCKRSRNDLQHQMPEIQSGTCNVQVVKSYPAYPSCLITFGLRCPLNKWKKISVIFINHRLCSFALFLDPSSHLYKRVCLSIRR